MLPGLLFEPGDSLAGTKAIPGRAISFGGAGCESAMLSGPDWPTGVNIAIPQQIPLGRQPIFHCSSLLDRIEQRLARIKDVFLRSGEAFLWPRQPMGQRSRRLDSDAKWLKLLSGSRFPSMRCRGRIKPHDDWDQC